MQLIDADRIQRIWRELKARCSDNEEDRGMTGRPPAFLYPAWEEYQNFAGWALVSGYRDDLVLGRIDEERIYGPDNCHWIAPGRTSGTGTPSNLTGRLTADSVELAMQCSVPEKWWDDDRLFLQVTNRGKGYWYVLIEVGRRKTRRKIGEYPSVSLNDARKIARTQTVDR
ncbi:Arm DNA-binding domain-containing protein [Alteraurantiacibacter buctensis]|uniref:Integrase arm-type DNA-binding domain-containing protein n=1 Tax=Alteraurantiacibacter buctensis TaxID=1503981 RepID=A0A844YZY7_9SPHN|nr:Arm DNA-binding domain-containing protein [Alteraurantiacibacter buctensis]MXO72782.1 integrase arm-type DNA-binding domain-containing protein [Alteraurantiacibacter buctensis]